MEYKGLPIASLQGKDCTLILPAVSVGHVGQLCLDLLITSLGAKRVGRLNHVSLYPVVGVDAHAQDGQQTTGDLQTALEVYSCPEKRLFLLQQRSPCIPGCQRDFCHDLVEWVKHCQFQSVVMLGSIDAQQRVDDELCGDQFRFACTDKAQSANATLSGFGWKEATRLSGDKLHLPGSGMAKRLFTHCSSEGLPLSLALWFSLPGCQVLDAIHLAGRVNDWLQLVEGTDGKQSSARPGSQWVFPSSWKVYMPEHAEQMLY